MAALFGEHEERIFVRSSVFCWGRWATSGVTAKECIAPNSNASTERTKIRNVRTGLASAFGLFFGAVQAARSFPTYRAVINVVFSQRFRVGYLPRAFDNC